MKGHDTLITPHRMKRERGWTAHQIRTFAPAPAAERQHPFDARRWTPFYSLADVIRIEATPEVRAAKAT